VRWQRLRIKIFVRDGFACRICKRCETRNASVVTALMSTGWLVDRIADTLFGAVSTRMVCDHDKPHRGSEARFWDETNLQCLCKSCHDSRKQKDEQATIEQRGVWY
jgi:5-methylcytosine-specific restriction protein A